jgi:hypothetical protein
VIRGADDDRLPGSSGKTPRGQSAGILARLEEDAGPGRGGRQSLAKAVHIADPHLGGEDTVDAWREERRSAEKDEDRGCAHDGHSPRRVDPSPRGFAL